MPQRRLRRRTVRPQGAKAPAEEEARRDASAGALEVKDGPAETVLAESPRFEAYYRLQGICPEAEWPQLLDSLRQGLPAAVRVNRGAHAAPALLAQLRRLREADGERRAYAARELPWYPHGLAWQWDSLCSWEIRKGLTHRRLKAYLLWLQDHGALTRQEAVSMVPPLCLEVRPWHSVLDLCAAPGSKTSQMLEMLHWEDAGERDPPTGVIVANEIVPKRADVLKHSVQRLGSPCVVVTQLDGQYFPNLTAEDGRPVRFDRVLCDVPCSGDGTIRKCPALWGKWSPKDALGLHHKQYTLLCRGLDLLRVGGRLVYSTCSFNPLEDEAVVAAALARCAGSVSLVPLPRLEGLCGSPGLAAWVVPHPDDAGLHWERHEEVPKELQRRLRPSLFPAAPGSEDAESWERQCGHCRRFLPHRANSGGFFAAAFERTAPTAQAERKHGGRRRKAADEGIPCETSVACQADAGAGGERAGEARPADEFATGRSDAIGGDAHAEAAGTSSRQQAPAPVLLAAGEFERVPTDDAGWLLAAEFFGLDASLGSRLFRRKDNERKFFCVSDSASRMLTATGPFKLRVPCAGVRVLERLGSGRADGAPPAWRCTQEGLPLLLRYGLRRRVALSRRLFSRVLEAREIEVAELLAAAEVGEARGLATVLRGGAAPQEDASASEAASSSSAGVISGGLALTLWTEGEEGTPPQVAVAALISGRSLQSYVTQSEAAAILGSIELEPRTEAILRGEAVDSRTAEQLGDAAACYAAAAVSDSGSRADKEAAPPAANSELSGAGSGLDAS